MPLTLVGIADLRFAAECSPPQPILRAAGRGDPFQPSATRRLNALGVLLLLGIPAIAIEGFLAATIATEGQSTEPYVEPALTISAGRFLPGVLMLALVGIFRRYANLSILKNNHARAIRFSTLTRLCEVLDCQPGDLLHFTGGERS